MALQPPSGLKELNPHEVEINNLLTNNLGLIYDQWGYKQVSPSTVERLDTLMAGGAIESGEIIKLVTDEPLGLRPEMTASILRCATTRLSHLKRPLRLWSAGTIFQARKSSEGGTLIEERLVNGVELLGVKNVAAELELLSLLFESLKTINLNNSHAPHLLLGHTGLMDLILEDIDINTKEKVRSALIEYDRITIEKIDISDLSKKRLIESIECRGKPSDVINSMRSIYGEKSILNTLNRLFNQMEPLADKQGINIQLDATFQPHFELYTGIVFQLICTGSSQPIVIARGGRYDELVRKSDPNALDSAGLGFSYDIDKIRDLLSENRRSLNPKSITLIAYGEKSSVENALLEQRMLHSEGHIAIIELDQCSSKTEAQKRLNDHGYNKLVWLN